MKRIALSFWLLAFPAGAAPYEGQCNVKLREVHCRAVEWVRFGDCVVKGEQKFLSQIRHLGHNAATEAALIRSLEVCDERYWYMTGVEGNAVDLGYIFLDTMREQAHAIGNKVSQ